MLSILMETSVAAAIGACAGLIYYGMTKIPAFQKQFQKFPRWVGFIVVLVVIRIFYPILVDGLNLLFISRNSYDHDFKQQCLVLKESYPDPLTVEQLEKIRSYINAEDPEVLRAYLLALTKAKESEFEREALRFDQPTDKSRIAEWTHWQFLADFYEEWQRPSPEGRIEYARKRWRPLTMPSGEKVELEYTISVIGQGSSTLVLRSRRPDFPNAKSRDEVIASLGSGNRWNSGVGAVGFTSYRFENSEGKGFTVKMTPRGGTLPLIEDDLK